MLKIDDDNTTFNLILHRIMYIFVFIVLLDIQIILCQIILCCINFAALVSDVCGQPDTLCCTVLVSDVCGQPDPLCCTALVSDVCGQPDPLCCTALVSDVCGQPDPLCCTALVSDVCGQPDPLLSVKAGLVSSRSTAAVPLTAVHVRAKLLDLSAQVGHHVNS